MKCPKCGAACELVAACSDREQCCSVHDEHDAVAAWRAVPAHERERVRDDLEVLVAMLAEEPRTADCVEAEDAWRKLLDLLSAVEAETP